MILSNTSCVLRPDECRKSSLKVVQASGELTGVGCTSAALPEDQDDADAAFPSPAGQPAEQEVPVHFTAALAHKCASFLAGLLPVKADYRADEMSCMRNTRPKRELPN